MLSISRRLPRGLTGRCATLRSICGDGTVAANRVAVRAITSAAAASSSTGEPGSSSSSSSSNGAGGPGARKVVEQVYSNGKKARDPFLREGTATSRFFRAYRTRLPFPARMLGIFFLGFSLGMVIEVFACKTHLYESVMMKKDARRHEFDEFVVDFRQNVERWQREDMSKRKPS